ncbi:PIG-L deacetylase family protein [Croceimicrobium hydrocarbonivorans]|uniref:PIG-L family deacetylase n=1 Tax=Croceimicrobium hydrocarbonivorans TaxID=2761580 RepID=A0A7H0VGD3_9FLAO|nr:PIG-L family deacetylase [Croceimicrobium hydrocarbonivorans]QNR24781.1 PIG-L family deacetylase [Croceimicrobium hydrocarbonivorans]
MMNHIKKVLLLAPHTDDAELGCGGTMAKFLEHGIEVHVAAFSTARASLPDGSDPDLLKNEFISAMDFFEIPREQLRIYDYEVRKLNYSRQEVLEELVKLRQEIAPDMVLVPSGSDLHQDHQVLYAEGLRAFKEITVWGYELPWNHISFSAQAFVTLEERHIQKKWDALLHYKSQFVKQRQYFTEEFIRGLATVRGTQVRAPFAEAYEVIRTRW